MPAGVRPRLSVPGARPLFSGKVRDVYEAGPGRLLLVATDNLSAFDVVLPTRVPGKGQVLTRVSAFWFRTLAAARPHHLLSTDVAEFPPPFCDHPESLADRAMLVRRTRRIDIECVVRARLTGSGYKDYLATGQVAGIELPKGLPHGAVLPEPIFTPASKADSGHDENLTFAQMAARVGREKSEALRERSLRIFAEAAAVCRSRGLELVDTKFEFGEPLAGGEAGFDPSAPRAAAGELVLIDEILSPDSSRFWEMGANGTPRQALDKQFVRDYLETLDWDKTDPGPELPAEIVARTQALYREAERRLTGA
ncbi:MAG: phosphoribosylaminoimidazolesuccinocarboxamide synthase [Candidatus Eisenbacteria bacterium]|nr:phosphoribosylaminoimidazolesuccinocarboxamide synthase [Candidatus Eisenbacteria bacterium]